MASLVSYVPLLAARDPETTSRISRGESIGLAFDTFAGVASTIAATCILIVIFFRFRRDGWSSWEALDIPVMYLFFAELIQGISHVMDLKWVIDGGAETGTFCTAQGLLQQLGETSVALATLTIAIQTFLTIWWLKYLSRTISLIICLVELLFIVLFVGIGFGIHTRPPNEYYAAPTPYWCWIGRSYTGERIGGEYLWFWLALFVSLALYTPLFLLHRNIIKPGTHWFSPNGDLPQQQETKLQPGESSSGLSNASENLSRGNLRLWSTILYPTLYCVVILPLSVVRFIGFKEEAATGQSHSRPVATFLVAILFSLSGLLNALLYPLTRARFFKSEQQEAPTAPVMRYRTSDASSVHSATAASVQD